VDFLLSKQGQEIIAEEGTLPVMPDVKVADKFNLPTPEDAVKRGIKVDYPQMSAEKVETIKKFSDIMQGK
jgi:iron(III) transport system substrate-binding protein